VIPGPIGPALYRLAEAYYEHLFAKEARRLAHHFAILSPERWLSLELAFVFNEQAETIGLPGWTAIVERQHVDVTLVPPCDPRSKELPADVIRIEIKPAAPEWWVCGWPHIRKDLIGREGKPRPSVLVCFIIHDISLGKSSQRQSTAERYASFLATVPTEPSEFSPIEGHPFALLSSSPIFDVAWSKPVIGRSPEGYAAKVRIVWLALPEA
jgi:hypothetical protein